VSKRLRALARALSADDSGSPSPVRIAARQPVDSEPGRPHRTDGDPHREMTPSPTVTVLLTAYNRERYIRAAIESVLAQTFTDFELIVSDDRSHDATVAAAEEYARRDPRIRIVVNERNLGD